MKNLLKKITTILVIAAVAAGATACGSQTVSNNNTSEGGEEKVLYAAVKSVADQPFDPALIALSAIEQIEPLNDTLLHVDKDGNYTEGLADQWKYSDDYTSFTIHLRDGLTFHNGDEVTSEDVKFTFEYYASEASNQSDKIYFTNYIKSIDTPDKQTVIVNFTEPFTEFEYIISEGGTGGGIIIPKNYFEEVGEDGYNAAPIGTGAFEFVSFTAGQEIVYKAYDGYWAGRAKIDKIVFRQVSEENTLVAGLQSGEYDWANISYNSISAVEASPNLRVENVDYGSSLGVFISGAYDNNGKAAQNNLVREALYTSINREELTASVFANNAILANVWGVFPFTNGYNGESQEIAYDVDGAKALLEEAGYPGAFEDPIIKLYYTESKPYNKEVAQALQSYWEAIGVQVELVTTDPVTLSEYYKANPLDPEFEGALYLFDPPKKYSANDAIAPFFPEKSIFRLIQGNETLENDVKKLLQVYGSERESVVTEILNEIEKAHVAIPLVYPSKTYAVSDRVKSWDSTQSAHWGYYFYTFELN